MQNSRNRNFLKFEKLQIHKTLFEKFERTTSKKREHQEACVFIFIHDTTITTLIHEAVWKGKEGSHPTRGHYQDA